MTASILDRYLSWMSLQSSNPQFVGLPCFAGFRLYSVLGTPSVVLTANVFDKGL